MARRPTASPPRSRRCGSTGPRESWNSSGGRESGSARASSPLITELGLEGHFSLLGRPCNLVFATRDRDRRPSQPFRTLFLQELVRRRVLAPSLVVSFSHSDADIDRTVEAFRGALTVYRKGLNDGVEKYLAGPSVKPVFRPRA